MTAKETPNNAPFTDDELKQFLASRRIVIADPARASGRSLRKFLMQLGAKSEDVDHCETLDESRAAVFTKKPQILFVDASFGLELVQEQQSVFESGNDRVTIVLTSDLSASEMGRIAEADIDSVLVKPFHYQGFLESIWVAFGEKIKPTEYTVQLEKAKGLFKAGNYDEAELVLDASRSLDPSPTLAFYYLGMIQDARGDLAQSIFMFEEGLKLNARDYRCLTGLFDVRLKAAQFGEAYELAKRIHADFPVSPTRILDLVRLSVQMRRFEDVIDYCRIFQSLDQREEPLCRAVIAGMLVCSKYLVLKGNRDRGLQVLRNAARISVESGMLLTDVLRYFVETGYPADGLTFYEKMPDELKRRPEIRMLHVELLHGTGDSVAVLEQGEPLTHTELRSERLFDLLIENARKAGRPAKQIERFIFEAGELPKEKGRIAS